MSLKKNLVNVGKYCRSQNKTEWTRLTHGWLRVGFTHHWKAEAIWQTAQGEFLNSNLRPVRHDGAKVRILQEAAVVRASAGEYGGF